MFYGNLWVGSPNPPAAGWTQWYRSSELAVVLSCEKLMGGWLASGKKMDWDLAGVMCRQ